MLPPLSVPRRNYLNRGGQIAFGIKPGVIFSTFDERAGNTVRASDTAGRIVIAVGEGASFMSRECLATSQPSTISYTRVS
jgi:hypothetical protein